MEQTIRHGQTIDAVTSTELDAALEKIKVEPVVGGGTRTRERRVINLDASGNGSAAFQVGRMYDWFLETVCFATLQSLSTGQIVLAENDIVSPSNFLMIKNAPVDFLGDGFSDDLSSLWVPAGTTLIAAIFGGNANSIVGVNLQVRLEPQRV